MLHSGKKMYVDTLVYVETLNLHIILFLWAKE